MDYVDPTLVALEEWFEELFDRCQEVGIWEDLADAVDRRDEDGEYVSGDFILETWKAMVVSRGLTDD
jgi:hypothetical protein